MTSYCENRAQEEKIQILLGSGRTKQLPHAESGTGVALQTWPATTKPQTLRNAFKILEENSFHSVTISHAKTLIERKRNVQISMTSKNLSPMYLSHRKALQDTLRQHNGVNPDRQWQETQKKRWSRAARGVPRLRAKGDRGREQSAKGRRPPVHSGAAQKAHSKMSPDTCPLDLNFGKHFNNFCELWLSKL